MCLFYIYLTLYWCGRLFCEDAMFTFVLPKASFTFKSFFLHLKSYFNIIEICGWSHTYSSVFVVPNWGVYPLAKEMSTWLLPRLGVWALTSETCHINLYEYNMFLRVSLPHHVVIKNVFVTLLHFQLYRCFKMQMTQDTSHKLASYQARLVQLQI